MKDRLSDQIYARLRESIIAGEIKPNTFLVESETAARYGVSKAPVKAALQTLTQEGYLICFPRRGYMVASISVDEYEYVRELRAHIEQLSVRMAIKRASDEEIQSLGEFSSSRSGERNPFKTQNTRFHIRLAEISKNKFIGDVLYKLLGYTSRYAFMQQVDDSFHGDIVEAMLARDVDRALDLLEKDLNPASLRYHKTDI